MATNKKKKNSAIFLVLPIEEISHRPEGKNIVFAMTIKLIPEFRRNQEIPEKF